MKQKRKRLLFTGIIAAIAVVLILWTIWENVTVGVTHYTVASSRFPASFDHYKIVVVSDLHNAEFGKENDPIIRLVKEENPDMIAFTGDLIDSSRTNIETAGKLAQNLAEIAPCYYVTGNHEAWIGEQYQILEKKLLDASVVTLHDNFVLLTKNEETIQLAGLDDPDFTDRDSSIQQSMLETKLANQNLNISKL